ncbi:hypothetical protein EVAR_93278_1 [Eumeta japonica]|uniref:Uncharacterized protein n=1 Tax=Eumeta variegata TaxID=151549 RepID=A0A4C1TY52_EUMVA|nr:hypothetical protein EVAR_93278_1 [Eumeta japonica]
MAQNRISEEKSKGWGALNVRIVSYAGNSKRQSFHYGHVWRAWVPPLRISLTWALPLSYNSPAAGIKLVHITSKLSRDWLCKHISKSYISLNGID